MSKEKSHLIVGIDIGSNTIKMCAVLHYDNPNLIPKVLDIVEVETEAVYKGNITDEDILMRDINQAINQFSDKVFSKKSHIIVVGLNTVGIGSVTNSSHVLTSSINKEVSKLDLDRLEKEASIAVAQIKNKKIVFTSAIRYRLDQNEILGSPLGLLGKKIEGKFLFVYSASDYIDKIENAFTKLGLNIEDLEVGSIAESIPLLNRRQRISGTALINFGHSTTSLIVFENNKPILVSILGYGSDDITKDIALGLQLTLEEAENIKIGKSDLAYSKRKFEDIVEARIEFICEKINLELDKINRRELLPGGIILTGGGSKLFGIDNLFKKYMKLPIRYAEEEIKEFSENQILDSNYARAYGLTFLAPSISSNFRFSKYFKNFFKSIGSFFKKLTP